MSRTQGFIIKQKDAWLEAAAHLPHRPRRYRRCPRIGRHQGRTRASLAEQWPAQTRFRPSASGEVFAALERWVSVHFMQKSMTHSELTGRRIGLERRDLSRLSNFVRATVIHIHGLQQEDVALFSHARCDSFHNLAVDRLLVIGDEILVEKLLNLVG